MKRVCTPDIFLFPKFSEAYICFPFFAHPYLVSCDILCSCREKYKASRENSYPSAFEQTELEARMLKRGDSRENVNMRLEHDEIKFGMMEDFCDIIVRNMDLEEYFLPGVSFFNVPANIQFLMNPPIPILPGVRLG